MELLDIVTEDGTPTGKTVDRDTAHSGGILHRTAHVWVVRFVNDQYDTELIKEISEDFPKRFKGNWEILEKKFIIKA